MEVNVMEGVPCSHLNYIQYVHMLELGAAQDAYAAHVSSNSFRGSRGSGIPTVHQKPGIETTSLPYIYEPVKKAIGAQRWAADYDLTEDDQISSLLI